MKGELHHAKNCVSGGLYCIWLTEGREGGRGGRQEAGMEGIWMTEGREGGGEGGREGKEEAGKAGGKEGEE